MLSNPNILINSGFDVWQRGTEFNNLSAVWDYHITDMWALNTIGNSCICNISKTDNGIRLQIQNTEYLSVNNRIEDFAKFKNKTVTISAFIRSFSGESVSLGIGDDLSRWYPGGVMIYSPGFYTATFNVPDTIQGLSASVGLNPGKTFSAEFEIDYIKLEFGEVATAYVPDNYAETLTKCQRYYQRKNIYDWVYARFATAYGVGPGHATVQIPLKIPMRITPTVNFINIDKMCLAGSGQVVINLARENNVAYSADFISEGILADGIEAGKVYELMAYANSSADLELSAEL